MKSRTHATIAQTDFKGLRTDRGQKFIGPEYFYDIRNFDYDDLIGANKVTFPAVVYNGNSSHSINLIYEYSYLDSSNNIITEPIIIYNGTIYKNFLSFPVAIKSGLTMAPYTAAVFNDKLFLTNGNDYPIVYDGTYIWQMGAPRAEASLSIGNLNGSYYYAMTYVTSGGEEVIGTVSNTISVTNGKINLTLPIGYAGTTSRKIYRTQAGGSVLKLVTTIADNSTDTYLDNTADGSLGATIPAINNECPKPFFIEVSHEKLIGAVVTEFPTQIYVTDPEIEVWDAAVFTDISNTSKDNSAIQGMALDYDLIVLGTSKDIYTVDVSGETPNVVRTRSNVGVKNGYSMATVPASNTFPGGVIFVSTLDDVRIFNGNFNQPVATSLDNLKTDNFSQVIRPNLLYELTISNPFVFGRFFQYKYHLILNDKIYVFDIRKSESGGWTIFQIETESYTPLYSYIGFIGQSMYIGQKNSSIVEKFYAATTYRGEPCSAYIQSGQLLVSDQYKYFKYFNLIFVISNEKKVQLDITLDGDAQNSISVEFELGKGAFSSAYFSPNYYSVAAQLEDYRTTHINRWGRWIQYRISSDDPVLLRGFSIEYDEVNNEEG